MGRPRKADQDVVVRLFEQSYGTVVTYDGSKSNPYGVVRSDSIGRSPRGPVIWLDATEIAPTGRISRTPGRVYRKNVKYWGPPEVRNCGCHCCPHMDLDRGEPTH